MKEAYLVIGPESSGSRCVHNLLQAAGCHGVRYTYLFPHDGRPNELFREDVDGQLDTSLPLAGDRLVWHRSVPDGLHGIGRNNPADDLFPLVEVMVEKCRRYEYSVHAVIVARDWWAMGNSQISRLMADDWADAEVRMRAAYRFIFDTVSALDVPFTVVSYDSLARFEGARAAFVRNFGLEYTPIEITDANQKWFPDGHNYRHVQRRGPVPPHLRLPRSIHPASETK